MVVGEDDLDGVLCEGLGDLREAGDAHVRGEDVAEQQAYEITRLLLHNRDRLPGVHPSLASFNPYTAWRNVPAPVHPGAARAYGETGFTP